MIRQQRYPHSTDPMLEAFRAVIVSIPKGKVATYGQVAIAAGYPGAARQVARALRTGQGLPWQRVVGSGGRILLRGESAQEQRFRLELEGVRIHGSRVPLQEFQAELRPWE